MRAEKLAGVPRRKIVLAGVQARMEQRGEIGAVVDHESCAGFAAEARHFLGGGKKIAAPMRLVADLQDAGAAFKICRGGHRQRDPAPVERFGIENGIHARKPEHSFAASITQRLVCTSSPTPRFSLCLRATARLME